MMPRPFRTALANHKSALKRIRQSERRRKRNQHIRTQMRTMVKYCREAFETGDQAKAADAFKVAAKFGAPRPRASFRSSGPTAASVGWQSA